MSSGDKPAKEKPAEGSSSASTSANAYEYQYPDPSGYYDHAGITPAASYGIRQRRVSDAHVRSRSRSRSCVSDASRCAVAPPPPPPPPPRPNQPMASVADDDGTDGTGTTPPPSQCATRPAYPCSQERQLHGIRNAVVSFARFHQLPIAETRIASQKPQAVGSCLKNARRLSQMRLAAAPPGVDVPITAAERKAHASSRSPRLCQSHTAVRTVLNNSIVIQNSCLLRRLLGRRWQRPKPPRPTSCHRRRRLAWPVALPMHRTRALCKRRRGRRRTTAIDRVGVCAGVLCTHVCMRQGGSRE